MAMQMRTPMRKDLGNTRTWHGSAFIMEALALLLFLVVCMAVLMQMLGFSYHRSEDADRLSAAVLLATDEAERFAASPLATNGTSYYGLVDGVLTPLVQEEPGCFVVEDAVSSNQSASGAMYDLDIVVLQNDETLYELTTSHYISNEGMS